MLHFNSHAVVQSSGLKWLSLAYHSSCLLYVYFMTLRRVWESEMTHCPRSSRRIHLQYLLCWEMRLGGQNPRYRIHFLSEVQRAPYPERKLKWATQHLIEKMLLSFLVCVSKQCLREGKSKDLISWADTSGSDNPCLSVKGIARVDKFFGDKHVYGPYKHDLSCCHLPDQKQSLGGTVWV